MSQKYKKLLLKEYQTPKGAHQLILNTHSKDNTNISDYFDQLIIKFSTFKISTILEIHPEDSSSISLDLRKKGYKVTTIPFSIDKKAVGVDKDGKGDHYIIGDSFELPKVDERFDTIFLTQGIIGQFIEQTELKNFLNQLYNYLSPNGMLFTEFWHCYGVEISSASDKEHKDWEIIETYEKTILRLTNTKFNFLTSILEIDIKYIIETENKAKQAFEKYNETNLYRLYTISEFNGLFLGTNLETLIILKMNSFEDPVKKTFRIMSVVKKIA